MKVKQIARLLAIVLTLVTMVSCLAVFMVTDVYAGSYLAFDGAAINSKWTGAYQANKSLSGKELTITATGSDPYFFISGLAENVFQTYPFLVIRYKSDHLGTFEVHCGHPNTDSCRVSMPVVPTNGQWGVLFYDFSVIDKSKRSWNRFEPMTVNGETITIGEIVMFTDRADADAYGYVYANAGARSGATGGCVVVTHNDFDYWNSANGRKGEVRTSSIDIARKNNGRFKEGGYYTRITASGADPWIEFGNNTTFKNAANSYTYLSIRYRASGGSNIRAYTNTNSGSVKSAAANITGDQTWRWATITLNKDNSNFRLDYIDAGSAAGLWIDIAEMYFHNGTNDLYNADVGNSSDRQGNNDGRKLDVRMYFLHRDNYTYFENSSSVSKISTGDLAGNYRENQTSNFRYGSQTRSVVGRTFYYVAGTHSAHNESSAVTAATCQKAGNTRYTCKLCNDIRDVAIAQLSHNSGRDEITTQPTCVDTGVRTYYCTNGCGQVQKTETVAATGIHDSNKSISAVAATCTATGLTAGKNCSVCNKVMVAQTTIEKLPHTEVTDAAVDATCTTAGLTAGCHCSVCSTVITAQTETPALGHNEVIDAAVAADCTHAGMTEGKHCDRCDEITLPQVPVEALGHNIITSPKVEPTYTTVGHEAGSKCSRCADATVQGKEIAKLNPLLSYNVALNEKFAVNMTYVAFDGATITVVDESGTAYTFTATNTGKTHTDGLPIWSIRIADISARDIGHTFTVSESLSGYSSDVSVDGYCGQVDNMYKDATVESLTAGYVASGMTEEKAQATAIKVLQAYDTTQKITIYGQAAKNYFDQDHGNHEALQTQIDSYTPTGVVQEVSNTGLVKFKGATVVFGDEVELLLKMENYHREKIFVKMGNGEYVEVPENEINSRLSTDGTYVYFSIIVKPDEFSTAISVRAGTWVMGEDGNNYYAGGSTVTYSVDKYIANMQSKYAGKTDAKSLATLNMVNALGNYGHSASTYAKS